MQGLEGVGWVATTRTETRRAWHWFREEWEEVAALKLSWVTVVLGVEAEAALLVVGVVASQVINNTRFSFEKLFCYHLLFLYLIVMYH